MNPGNDPREAPTAVDPARDFLDFWRNYFEQTAIQTRGLIEGMNSGRSLDRMHGQWMEAMAEGFESFMRTPAFLEVLKQSLKRMVDLKLAQDQMTQSVAQHAGMPQAADITGVFERVNSAERAIMTRLAQIDERLRSIEVKLDSSPKPKKPRKGKGKTEAAGGGHDEAR